MIKLSLRDLSQTNPLKIVRCVYVLDIQSEVHTIQTMMQNMLDRVSVKIRV
jgi:hypothetical protein